MIALTASILGIILSYMTTPIISDVFAQQSGIKWIQGFDLYISTMSLGLIIIIVMLIAYISSRKIKRLNPIVALRGGIITHNFKKNHLPLEHSREIFHLLQLKPFTEQEAGYNDNNNNVRSVIYRCICSCYVLQHYC